MKLSLIFYSIKNNMEFLIGANKAENDKKKNNLAILKEFRKGDLGAVERLSLLPLDFDITYGDGGNIFSIIANNEKYAQRALTSPFDTRHNYLFSLLKNPAAKNFSNFTAQDGKYKMANDLLMALIRTHHSDDTLKEAIELLFERGFVPSVSEPYIAAISETVVKIFQTKNTKNYLDIIKLLVSKNCNPNLGPRIKMGFMSIEQTPLHLALTYNNLELTKLLIELGAKYDTMYLKTMAANNVNAALANQEISINECFDYLFNIKKATDEKNNIDMLLPKAKIVQENDERKQNRKLKI